MPWSILRAGFPAVENRDDPIVGRFVGSRSDLRQIIQQIKDNLRVQLRQADKENKSQREQGIMRLNTLNMIRDLMAGIENREQSNNVDPADTDVIQEFTSLIVLDTVTNDSSLDEQRIRFPQDKDGGLMIGGILDSDAPDAKIIIKAWEHLESESVKDHFILSCVDVARKILEARTYLPDDWLQGAKDYAKSIYDEFLRNIKPFAYNVLVLTAAPGAHGYKFLQTIMTREMTCRISLMTLAAMTRAGMMTGQDALVREFVYLMATMPRLIWIRVDMVDLETEDPQSIVLKLQTKYVNFIGDVQNDALKALKSPVEITMEYFLDMFANIPDRFVGQNSKNIAYHVSCVYDSEPIDPDLELLLKLDKEMHDVLEQDKMKSKPTVRRSAAGPGIWIRKA
jgi:hypothetical protein